MRSLLSRCAVALVATAAVLLPPQASAQGESSIAPAAKAYLEHVLGILETESLNRANVDWADVRAAAYRTAAGAQSTRDTYAAIMQAVGSLGDGHSRFVPPIEELARMTQVSEAALLAIRDRAGPAPESRRVHARVGYVRVPAFSGPEPDEFAERILERVFEVDDVDVCGWIVDVRGNTGGNMWPMLQGLLPILGGGVPGYFRYPDETWTPWVVNPNVLGDRRLSRDTVAVAVLQDEATASSGEAVVVAFRGRQHTRTFGRPTAGLSTANRTINLSDGAKLLLAVAVYADRERQTYGNVISPDQPLAAGLSDAEALSIAQSWLLRQRTCSHPEGAV